MTITQPRKNLNVKQNEQLNEFIIKINGTRNLDEKQRAFATEDCLVRYLRARDYNVEKAYKMLMGTLEWRKEYKPSQINPANMKEQVLSGKCYVKYHDKKGRPFVVMTPRRENSDDHLKNIQWTVYLVERAIKETGPEEEKINLLIDFEGYSRKNSPPMWVAKEILSYLANHYPERLGTAYFLSTPYIFSFFWTIIKQFLDPVTKSKVKFVNGKPADVGKQLAESGIDMAHIEDRFGGNAPQPDMQVYWQQECERYQAIQNKFQQRTAFHVRTSSNTSTLSVDDLD